MGGRGSWRWRMRGAWMWPAFVIATTIEGLLLRRLPPYESGPPDLAGALLLAGALNLALVALAAPVAARGLRRRRRDLPRDIARDYAGTALLAAGCVATLVAGIAHRPAVLAEQADVRAQAFAVHHYVLTQAPQFRAGLASADTLRIDRDVYRTCVPGSDPKRPLCLVVLTDQQPPGIRRDTDRAPNAAYRR